MLDKAELRNAELESEMMKAEVLSARLDQAEARTAELESVLTTETESAKELRQRVDEAEAFESLLTTLLAWNRKDSEEFRAGFTDEGLAETVLMLPRTIGAFEISMRRLVDTSVSGDGSTIHAMFALGTQRNSVNFSLMKVAGVWKINGERHLSPKIRPGTTVADVGINECEFEFSTNSFVDGSVAFKLMNEGGQHHHLILVNVPEGLAPIDIQADQSLEGVEEIAFVERLEPGGELTVAFARPLDSGRYLFQCFIADGSDARVSPAEGTVGEFRVQ